MERQLSLQDRALEVGLSMSRLARESGVVYHRIQQGFALLGDEERAIEAVLDRYSYRRRIHHDRAAV